MRTITWTSWDHMYWRKLRFELSCSWIAGISSEISPVHLYELQSEVFLERLGIAEHISFLFSGDKSRCNYTLKNHWRRWRSDLLTCTYITCWCRAVAPVLPELDGIFTKEKNKKNSWRRHFVEMMFSVYWQLSLARLQSNTAAHCVSSQDSDARQLSWLNWQQKIWLVCFEC